MVGLGTKHDHNTLKKPTKPSPARSQTYIYFHLLNTSSFSLSLSVTALSRDLPPIMSRDQVAPNAIVLQDPSVYGQSGSPRVTKEESPNGSHFQAEIAACYSKKLQDDLKAMGLKIKEHEQNIKFLKSERNKLDDSILDMQVVLGKYHTASTPVKENEGLPHSRSEEEVVEQIVVQHGNSAAGIFCQLRTRHGTQVSDLPVTKDVLGIVATLGKVDDDNLSWILSEYLGLDTMLAIVCKTVNGVTALETYDKEGRVNTNSGIHGIGASIGRHLDGRFEVICLESLRPYVGEFIADDPQRRLDLLQPRLPNGEPPVGFIGFAVNMIDLDRMNLSCVTGTGYGLRETLFHNLFSSLQVYRTREEMYQALPIIRDGAVSLDGGIIKSNSFFFLGSRVDAAVKFPKSSRRLNFPENYSVTENQIKEMKWKKERIVEDMRREQELLDQTKFNFEIKKQEFVNFLTQTSSAVTQQQLQTAQRSTPR